MDDIDRRHLYRLLRDTTSQYGLAIHAYAFMGNHIHLLLTAPDGDALPRTMRKIGQCYVQAFNHRHRRSGPLWQGRFKSCIVGTERYLMAVYRYIELNPVRAAMVERPERYRWSSVHGNLGLIDDPMVTPHARYLALGATRSDRAAAYRSLLEQAIDPTDTERIRLHMQQERALGDQRFRAMVEKALGTPAQARHRGRPRHAPAETEET